MHHLDLIQNLLDLKIISSNQFEYIALPKFSFDFDLENSDLSLIDKTILKDEEIYNNTDLENIIYNSLDQTRKEASKML